MHAMTKSCLLLFVCCIDEAFVDTPLGNTVKVGLQFTRIGRANERPDIPLVEIDVNVSRQFQPMECPVAHSREL